MVLLSFQGHFSVNIHKICVFSLWGSLSELRRSLFFGAFFYQNMSTKPTERQGYVPTQIIEKREILTVRVSLSHFYPTLIRQLPSHFCFKTLLWVLAQRQPLRMRCAKGLGFIFWISLSGSAAPSSPCRDSLRT